MIRVHYLPLLHPFQQYFSYIQKMEGFYIWVLLPFKIISLILSKASQAGGGKLEALCKKKKTPGNLQAERTFLACSPSWNSTDKDKTVRPNHGRLSPQSQHLKNT